MRQFSCRNCGMRLEVPDAQLGQSLICPNCNTRQAVPLYAVDASPDPPPSPLKAASLSPRGPDCPLHYDLAYFMGVAITIIGFLIPIIGFFVAISFGRGDGAGFLIWFAGAIANGIIVIAFGQLVLMVRDIARNTWHP